MSVLARQSRLKKIKRWPWSETSAGLASALSTELLTFAWRYSDLRRNDLQSLGRHHPRVFRASEYRELISGQATVEVAREFLCNVFRTHYLSSHIVALCFASLPSSAAELLKENLLEEMGRSEQEKPHSALLLEMARGIGLSDHEIDRLIADARRQVAIFCATRVPVRPCSSFAVGAARNHEL